MIEAVQAYFDYISDKFGQTLDDGGNLFQFLLDYIGARIALILHAFMGFVLSLFGEVGKEAVSVGDVVASQINKTGLTNFNNFFYAIVGIVFIVFCIKYGVKLILKIIDIVGNYIPFT